MNPTSILTVVVPAASNDLTTLTTVKSELGITDNNSDVRLRALIHQASGACADYCHRVFGQETLSEQFRFSARFHDLGHSAHRSQPLVLRRRPVASITSVTENDVLLTAGDDYELDAETGMLYRLASGVASFCGWPNWGKIVVVYVAGYALLGSLPSAIERACVMLVKQYWYSTQRDPFLIGEEVPGAVSYRYGFGNAGDKDELPPDVIALLQLHRHIVIA